MIQQQKVRTFSDVHVQAARKRKVSSNYVKYWMIWTKNGLKSIVFWKQSSQGDSTFHGGQAGFNHCDGSTFRGGQAGFNQCDGSLMWNRC
mmetsp:Transcript_4722/g.8420  ORF Transcript_4722/g.8420 Transcript_4722/m.8420 type:complete len:90 (+) Transcript_4722:407-676(+)